MVVADLPLVMGGAKTERQPLRTEPGGGEDDGGTAGLSVKDLEDGMADREGSLGMIDDVGAVGRGVDYVGFVAEEEQVGQLFHRHFTRRCREGQPLGNSQMGEQHPQGGVGWTERGAPLDNGVGFVDDRHGEADAGDQMEQAGLGKTFRIGDQHLGPSAGKV